MRRLLNKLKTPMVILVFVLAVWAAIFISVGALQMTGGFLYHDGLGSPLAKAIASKRSGIMDIVYLLGTFVAGCLFGICVKRVIRKFKAEKVLFVERFIGLDLQKQNDALRKENERLRQKASLGALAGLRKSREAEGTRVTKVFSIQAIELFDGWLDPDLIENSLNLVQGEREFEVIEIKKEVIDDA